jgi:DNA helicase-2/ATP-dependent DNA helicase PcrA
MYRTNAQSRLLEEEFIRRGMPYRLVRGTRFYERREVRDILAYLRLIHNPDDGVSMARIINAPPRGIGAKTLSALENWAFKLDTSTFGALKKLQEEEDGTHLAWPSPFSARAGKALLSFASVLTTLIADRDQITLPELFDTTLSRSGYRDLLQDGSNEAEDRWDNLQELRRVTQQFASTDPSDALPLFLEQVALVSDADGLTEDNEGGPALLTLHAAKGLEFRAVFMVGMDEGMLPHKRSLDDIEAMQEERRLCYVGVTRAMDHLYLVHTFRRTTFGQSALSTPSRFLHDIPDELVDGRPHVSPPRQRARAVSADRSVVWADKASPTPSHPVRSHFAIGDTVAHTKFGEGVIIASHLTSDDQEVEVAFPGQGIKRLSVNVAPLEKLDQETAVGGKQ